MNRAISALLTIALGVGALFGVGSLIGWVTGFTSTDGGHVAVVRNGGWFDNHSIRQVIPVASALTSTGLWSSVHEYPTSERYYDVVPVGDDQVGRDAFRTPTSDGVDVGLTARFNFTLNTNPDSISAFDTAFGIRDFAGADGERRSPWDGDVGMETFLDQMVKPIIESSLRQQIGNVRCADLYASCALVQNGGGGTPQAQVNQQNGAVIQQIQDKIDAAFVANVNSQLGGNFFTAVRVSIVGVDLPAPIRTQITSAQAAFAAVSESQARAQQASADADANANRQRGYLACPTCAQLDEIRAQGDALAKIPSSVSVYAPGSGAGVVVQAGK